ncbi:MAG TPA: prolyl oligopeptidase family serine peptidase [Caulobacteraceae bacterium]
MKLHLHRVKATLAAAVIGLCAAPAWAAAPTARDLTRAPAISDVSISRDGEHIAALTSPDGDQVVISIWRTDAPDQRPVLLGSGKMRFLDVQFLKNDRLLVTAIQPYTLGSDRAHTTKRFVTDLNGEDWKPLLPEPTSTSPFEELVNALSNPTIVSYLPLDPKHVIVEDHRLNGEGDIYKLNVYSGVAQRIERGSEKFFSPVADLTGEIRAKDEFDFDNGKAFIATWLKNPDTGKLEEHFRWYAKDRVPVDVLGFDTDPNFAFVRTVSPGKDKAGIYVYDIRARKIVEPLFEHRMFEAYGLRRSTIPQSFGEVIGFTYQGPTLSTYWAQPVLAELAKNLNATLGLQPTVMEWRDTASNTQAKINVPTEGSAEIISYSEDFKRVIVAKEGPSSPSEYYLLTSDGKLSLLGRARPWIDPAAIGQTKLVEYRARDGLMIPGFLSLPPKSVFGPGPYPTVIMPHGGPWARDYMDWDVSGWPQYLTSRGYAVLKPQFRGSEGWGQKLWRAGDNEWGQKMQDDKDDGAKWLISQGVADPGRIAMFGYSYGGYAALAATIRPNGIYQCAISGAGAPDLAEFRKETFENRFGREFQNPTIGGLDVLGHAKEAQIPVFLYHGDRDMTVDIKQSREFAAKLKAAGKPYKFIEIPEMGHQYVTMTPSMMEQQLVEIENYLKTDCGPGGL